MSDAQTCGRSIPFTGDYCGRDGVVCEWCRNVDERWAHALDGFRCLAFVARDDERQRRSRQAWGVRSAKDPLVPLPYVAEVTGMAGEHVWVMLPDEDESRRLHWTSVRPLAPSPSASP